MRTNERKRELSKDNNETNTINGVEINRILDIDFFERESTEVEGPRIVEIESVPDNVNNNNSSELNTELNEPNNQIEPNDSNFNIVQDINNQLQPQFEPEPIIIQPIVKRKPERQPKPKNQTQMQLEPEEPNEPNEILPRRSSKPIQRFDDSNFGKTRKKRN